MACTHITKDNVYGADIMAESLQEFTGFMQWIEYRTAPNGSQSLDQANWHEKWAYL